MKDRDSATLRLPFSHHSHLWSHTIMSTVDAIPSIKLAPSSIFLYTSEDAWSRQPASHLPAVALGQKKSHTYLAVPPLDDWMGWDAMWSWCGWRWRCMGWSPLLWTIADCEQIKLMQLPTDTSITNLSFTLTLTTSVDIIFIHGGWQTGHQTLIVSLHCTDHSLLSCDPLIKITNLAHVVIPTQRRRSVATANATRVKRN